MRRYMYAPAEEVEAERLRHEVAVIVDSQDSDDPHTYSDMEAPSVRSSRGVAGAPYNLPAVL